MNVEFGYGRIKGVHRKTILKYLTVDLYISSYPIQKKAVSKQEKNIKERKTQYQKLKKQKLFIKFAAKTDSGAGKMKPFY